ncbi:MAG: DUF6785 family protein [Armatimonadota bacterium]
MAELAPHEDERARADPELAHGLSVRALTIAVLLLAVSLFWVRQAEMVSHACQITESVPPIPAVAGLILLAALSPLLRRVSRALRLRRGDILLVYAFLTIATPMASVGVVRMLFPCTTSLTYFAAPENDLAALQGYFPKWMAPRDPEVVRTLYEGAPDERVPWLAWIGPLGWWTLFFLAVFVTMLSLIVIFRRQWAEKEHLTFPICHMVLEVSATQEGRIAPFFRNPVMWVGFGLAFIYNLLNIFNAFNPAVPALGRSYDLGALFTEEPMSAIRPLLIGYRPAVLGIGYLVSHDVALSVWVFYLMTRFENVVASMFGYRIPGMPFDQEQSTGGYLALALFLVWVARGHLREVFRKAFYNDARVHDSDEPVSYRAAVIGVLAGFAFVVGFAVRAGMWLSTALIYFGLFFAFALVYSRVRSEAGAPMVWLFPFYQHKRGMLNAFGSKAFVSRGSFRNLTIFSTFMFMSRGYYQSSQASQIEALKLADESRLRSRSMFWGLIVALVLGFWGACYIHLQAYYQYGNNVLEGGTTQGGYRTYLALHDYLDTAGYMRAAKAPDVLRTSFVGGGFALVSVLVVLRTVFLRFPLHPLGFVMATTYGHHIWGPFFVVWLTKTVVFRLGGMRLYRRLIPFFLGIALGHFFTAGVIWGSIGIIGEFYRRYVVHFG